MPRCLILGILIMLTACAGTLEAQNSSLEAQNSSLETQSSSLETQGSSLETQDSIHNSAPLPTIGLSADGQRFEDSIGRPFRVWGVNYDHDESGQLLEDYWISDWPRVIEDMREIKQLGANVVRIHLQLGRFMQSPDQSDPNAIDQLKKLLQLAEELGLYLDLTGLGCYHRADVPVWYDALDEAERWRVQANFWQAIAAVGRDSPAVFCYDLMNEPILPGEKEESQWLTGELGGKHFVQRIALELRGRTRQQVAQAWVQQMTQAIRSGDQKHLITVGVIPWAHVFPKAKPIFYAPEVAAHLDFVSVHFYPEKGQIQKALDALDVYRIGKPLIIEEFFPLKCSIDEAEEFIRRANTDGVISFYWGTTIEEYEKLGDLKSSVIAAWLKRFVMLRP